MIQISVLNMELIKLIGLTAYQLLMAYYMPKFDEDVNVLLSVLLYYQC